MDLPCFSLKLERSPFDMLSCFFQVLFSHSHYDKIFQAYRLFIYHYHYYTIFRKYRDISGLDSRTYRGLTGGFLLLRFFSVGISVSPHVCFILDLILISMFLR